MKKLFVLAAMAVMATSANAQTVVFTETFESYNSIGDVEAVWTPSQAGVWQFGNTAGEGAESSNKWVVNPPATAATLKRSVSPTLPVSDADPVTLSYYTRTANWGNSRTQASVRGNGAAILLGLGTYNAAAANTLDPGNKWVARVLGWGNGPSGNSSTYYALLNGPDRVASVWTKLTMIGAGTTIKFEIDDVEVTADTLTGLTAPSTPVDVVQLGLGATTPTNTDHDSITLVHGADSNVSDWDLY